jgi:hypothetical protein
MRDLARIPWKPMEAAESAVYYRVRLRSNSGSFAVSIWFGSVGCPIPDKWCTHVVVNLGADFFFAFLRKSTEEIGGDIFQGKQNRQTVNPTQEARLWLPGWGNDPLLKVEGKSSILDAEVGLKIELGKCSSNDTMHLCVMTHFTVAQAISTCAEDSRFVPMHPGRIAADRWTGDYCLCAPTA